MIGDQTQVVGPVLQVLIGVAMLIGTLCTIALTWKKLMTNPPLPPGQEFVQRGEVVEMLVKLKSEILPTHADLMKQIDKLTAEVHELGKMVAVLIDRDKRDRRGSDTQGV